MSETPFLPPKQRRQRNREAVIAAIVEAARANMRHNGVAALNLNEIARALGMQTPSLYEYFPGKMALYDHLFRLGTRDLAAVLARTRDALSVTGWDQVERYFTVMLQWGIDNPDLFRLLFERHVPGFVPSDEAMAEMLQMLDDGQRQIDALLAAAGVEPGIPHDRVRDIIIALQHGITALHLANNPDSPANEGRFGRLIPLVVDMLRLAWTSERTRSER